MKTQIEKVNPARAREFLLRNVSNRPLRNKRVARYALLMQENKWVQNGDTIRFSIKGDLIDGQHRLHAIIKSNATIEMVLIHGLPSEAFATIDTCIPRTGADALALIGQKNAIRLSSVLPLLARYDAGMADKYIKYDNTEMLELLKRYPDLPEIMGVTHKFRKGLIPPSVLGACFYLFSKLDPKLADQFVEKVIEGINVDKNSNWYHLRERLLKNATSKAKLDASYVMALCIKAWNFTRRGTHMKFLRWRDVGEKAEGFPIAQ